MERVGKLSAISRENLEKRYNNLRNVIEGANLSIWEWNIQTDNLEINEQWAEIMGYTLEELEPISNDTWIDNLHPEDLIKSDNLIEKHLNGETDYYECDLRIKHKDGRWIWIKHKGKVIYRDDLGNPVTMAGTYTDITKEYEQALELERIFSISLDLLAILDKEGKFVKVNESWSKLLGISVEDLQGKSILGYIHKDDIPATLESIEKLKNGAEIKCFINRCKSSSGEYRYLEWKIRPYEGYEYAATRDVTDRVEYEKKILDTSKRDPLTNIYNRRYVFKEGKKLLEGCIATKQKFSVAMLDIDNFKKINDSYGHPMGDFVLKEFTQIINENLRTGDILGRYGGEEFIIILKNIDKDQSNLVVERILNILRNKRFYLDEEYTSITFSAGISDSKKIDDDELTLDRLIKLADDRMYQAKNTGKNKIIYCDL